MTDPKPPARPASYDKKVGLVLQGGGALGSYQAGVYEALASSEYLPDWVAGISIGAINAAHHRRQCAGEPRPPAAPVLGGYRRPLPHGGPANSQDNSRPGSGSAGGLSAIMFGQPGFFRATRAARMVFADHAHQLLQHRQR